jgi:hypothetical protein
VEAADPEQRLGLAAHITELLIELRRSLERRQLVRVLGELLWLRSAVRKESRMQNPAAGQGKIGFYAIQFPLGDRQCAHIATEDGAFIVLPGSVDSIFGADRRLRRFVAVYRS